jgi:hypothetical protein
MCDLTALNAFLGTAGAFIAGAIVTIGVAAALNNGFFSAAGSPAAMITAGALTVAAGPLSASLGFRGQAKHQCISFLALCSHRPP